MKQQITSLVLFVALLLPSIAYTTTVEPNVNTITATVLIASYDNDFRLLSWGSGFFVDEGIVVTNKHVIEGVGSRIYRVFATTDSNELDLECFVQLTKSDMKINLNDDVAYIRAFLPCAHGVLEFTDDPYIDDNLHVIGYPRNASNSLDLVVTSGSVTGHTNEGWLSTNALVDFGNSGGPVISNNTIIGVAVAKATDAVGNFIEAYFIPSTVIVDGLLFANNSQFGYIPGYLPKPASSSASSLSSSFTSSSTSSVRSSSFASSARIGVRPVSSSAITSASSSTSSVTALFTDVSRFSLRFAAIQSLASQGIVQGYSDGTFRPNAEINRAELLKILLAGFTPDEAKNESDCFTDVVEEWFAQYVCAAKRLEWVDGYADNTFKPGQTVNRAEAIKIITTAFGYSATSSTVQVPSDVATEDWFYPYVQAAVELGVVQPGIRFLPAQNLTRGQAAAWIAVMQGV
jgi:hypothetical protein